MLVHGLGGSARWWRATAAELARDHRVIVPELPGFGYRPGGRRFALADATAVLGGVLERLGHERADLVGHSLGALACLTAAAAEPARVRRLVLIAPPVRTASPRMAGNVLPVVRTLLRLPPSAALTVAGDIAMRSPAALLRAAGEVLALDGDPGIGAEPPVPTLVMWGARDALVPIGGAGWVTRTLPRAEITVIPAAGHVPMLDRPEEVNAALRRFLTG
ncbi:MAG TPA: alpha/beta fold hydrolase [Miltoncostaea sp.]|nr:alpha/beta fold hydrolase [Miltoncostaea sp.]